MAESLGSWLASAIVHHDREFGADPRVPWLGSRYCQLTQFDTYRTPEDPHARITGCISDRSHFVRVAFDVKATDKFEQPVAGLPAETLTSHLRAVFRILSFRFKVVKSPRRSGLEVPRVLLEILEWEVHSGDRNDPVFWDTPELGTGPKDGEVQRVLRKWWFGESTSEPSQLGPSKAGPSAHIGSHSQSIPHTSLPIRITLSDFLEPYLHPTEGKRPKPIPEWIFDIPEEAKRDLQSVQVFGLDLAALDVTPRKPVTQPFSSDRKGKGREVTPSPPPPGQSTNPNSITPLSAKLNAPASHEDSDSESDIPIRPLTQARRKFDPLAFGTASPDPAMIDGEVQLETGEEIDDNEGTDDGLSDYERGQRKAPPAKGSQEVAVTVTVQRNESLADVESASQSLPESQRSAQDFSLSRYAGASQPNLPASAASHVLVDDSDHSGVKTTGTQSLSQNAPPVSPPPTPKRQRAPPAIHPGDTSAETHADDELSQRSIKRARTSPPSVLSYLNPMTYLRSASRPVTQEPVFFPIEMRRVKGRSLSIKTSSKGEGSLATASPTVQDRQDLGSPRTLGEHRVTTSPLCKHAKHPSAAEVRDRSPLKVSTPPPQHSASPLKRRPKLGGFKLDLVPLDGLEENWVVGMTKVAEDLRRARAARLK